MKCINTKEPSSPYFWWDNYICFNNDVPYDLEWTHVAVVYFSSHVSVGMNHCYPTKTHFGIIISVPPLILPTCRVHLQQNAAAQTCKQLNLY